MLTIVAEVRAKPEHLSEVRSRLEALVNPTRLEAGCIDYILHQSNDDPCHFLFFENWECDGHLEAHAKSPHMEATYGRDLVGKLDGELRIVKLTKLA